MTDTEKHELDKWLTWAGGDVSSWGKVDSPTYEARARKDGNYLRHLADTRSEAIAGLKNRYEAAVGFSGGVQREPCTSCGKPSVVACDVRANSYEASVAGITLSGPIVDWLWDGNRIHKETVQLCQLCIGVQLHWLITQLSQPTEWLKVVRRKP